MHSIPLLDALATWCLDHLAPDPPRLIGVESMEHTVLLHCIELCAEDPLSDLMSLVAPATWNLVVVLCASSSDISDAERIRVAHVASREGRTFTEFRSTTGASSSMRNAAGRIAEVCSDLFAPPTVARSSTGGAIRADATASISERAE